MNSKYYVCEIQVMEFMNFISLSDCRSYKNSPRLPVSQSLQTYPKADGDLQGEGLHTRGVSSLTQQHSCLNNSFCMFPCPHMAKHCLERCRIKTVAFSALSAWVYLADANAASRVHRGSHLMAAGDGR